MFVLSFAGVSTVASKEKINISKIQEDLKTLGYYQGDITGKMDDATVKAVKAFQQDNKLKVDGKIGKQTLKALRSAMKNKAKEQKPIAK
jgi:peptidoglycan endopeptidase LytF